MLARQNAYECGLGVSHASEVAKGICEKCSRGNSQPPGVDLIDW